GKAKGTANVTLTALDGSGLTATAKINVVEPGLFISGPGQVLVGDEITLSSRLMTADYEQITSYAWSIVSGSDKISINPPPNEATIKVTGKLAGSSTVKLTVNTNQGNIYTATAPILVKSKLTALKLNNAKIYVGKEKVLIPEFTPNDVANK
ncbi:PKD domain-containing protein, partial [Acinetobacter sp. AGC35]